MIEINLLGNSTVIELLKTYIKEFDINMRCQEMNMDIFLDKISTEEGV